MHNKTVTQQIGWFIYQSTKGFSFWKTCSDGFIVFGPFYFPLGSPHRPAQGFRGFNWACKSFQMETLLVLENKKVLFPFLCRCVSFFPAGTEHGPDGPATSPITNLSIFSEIWSLCVAIIPCYFCSTLLLFACSASFLFCFISFPSEGVREPLLQRYHLHPEGRRRLCTWTVLPGLSGKVYNWHCRFRMRVLPIFMINQTLLS